MVVKILVIEDDELLRETVVTVLKEEHYAVEEANSGDEGLFKANQGIYDLLIIDVMLPGMDGIDIVRRLREQGITVAILFLTARDSIADRVKGLESGADDYLAKPFAFPELLARVKALLRRSGHIEKEGSLSYGPLKLEIQMKEGFVGDKALQLTLKEYELLEFFILNSQQILAREQIFDRIWGFESETNLGIVDLYIHYLRRKLAIFGYDTWIRTVRGVGFMLKE